MSSIAMKWARGQQVRGPAALKSLVNAIAARADNRGAAWCSQATLAADMSVSERYVRQLLPILERLGLITREVRSRGRAGRATDMIRLALDGAFRITADAVRAARNSLKTLSTAAARLARNAHECRVNAGRVPTGTTVPGTTKTAQPSREYLSGVTSQSVRETGLRNPPWWRVAFAATASWLMGVRT